MKKRILSAVLAAALAVGTMLAAFPGIVASAGETTVWAKWNVADDLLKSIKKASESGSNIAFDTISYQGNYFGNTGIGAVVYSNDASSFIKSADSNAAAQPWRCQLEIANNRGSGVNTNTKGVVLYSAYRDTQKLKFTAPVNGKYNFVPAALGGEDSIAESLYANSGAWNVTMTVDGAAYDFGGAGTLAVAAGSKAELPLINDILLDKGDVIELSFTPAANLDDWSVGGNNIKVNFDVELTDEIAPQVLITEVEKASFNVTDEIQVTNTSAAVPAAKGIFSVGYVNGTGKTGAALSTTAKSAIYKVADTGNYTWYYGLYGNDSSYGLKAYPDTDKIKISSKYSSVQGIIITADKKGTYTLSAASVTKDGGGGMNLVVEDNNGTILQSNGGSDPDGFSYTVRLDAGEKMYIYADRTGADWKTANIYITGLTLDVEYTPVRVVPPVYNTTEVDVATELMKQNAVYTTDYQDPATFTYSGKLEAAYVKTADLTAGSAWARTDSATLENRTYTKFSNAKQGWDNNTMYAYASGQSYGLRWVYDYGDVRMGFKYVASATSDLNISSGEFAGSGLNLYIYKESQGVLTQVGSTVAVSAGAALDTTIPVTEGDVYYIVIGKAKAGYNDKRDTKVPYITLSEKVLVSEGYTEELPLEYGDDPNYVYKYEGVKSAAETAEELAAAAEYALADGTLSVTFPAADEDKAEDINWAVWVEQNGLWVKLASEDGLTFSVSGVTSEDGVYKTYVLCTDASGLTLLKTYDNYVDTVTTESVGNAVISAVYVDGVLVDREAFADITDASVDLAVEGANIVSLTYSVNGGEEVAMTDGAAAIALTDTGAYEVVITAEAQEGKEGATKKIVINAYKTEDDKTYGSIDSVETVVEGNTVTVTSAGSATSYDFKVAPAVYGTASSKNNSTNASEAFDMTGKYGYYYASVHAKDANGNIDDVAINNFYIARPGGTWKLTSTANGSITKVFDAAVGETIEFAGTATFDGIESSEIEYMLFKKDANGTSVIKTWGAWNKASFTPAYAGHYEITVAARAKGAGSYEVYQTFYVTVAGNRAAGTIAIGNTAATAKSPVTITANVPESSDALLYRFTIMTDNNVKVIQKYSPSNTCTWIPTKAGTYTVKVEVISADSFGMYDIRNTIDVVVG